MNNNNNNFFACAVLTPSENSQVLRCRQQMHWSSDLWLISMWCLCICPIMCLVER